MRVRRSKPATRSRANSIVQRTCEQSPTGRGSSLLGVPLRDLEVGQPDLHQYSSFILSIRAESLTTADECKMIELAWAEDLV